MASAGLTRPGLIALSVLSLQNSFKSIFMRFVMKDQPEFLLSTAIVTIEILKLVLCVLYIQLVEGRKLQSIYSFLRQEHRSSKLLTVPAASYIFQMSMEYVAYAHLEANIFAVIVQTKMLFTAIFFVLVLKQKLVKKQAYSLLILTVGVMLCSMKPQNTGHNNNDRGSANKTKGVLATLAIAMSSGLASVYTEKVIKANAHGVQSPSEISIESSKKDDQDPIEDKDVETTAFMKNPSVESLAPMKYSLAYTQVQLAVVSLVILGVYCLLCDYSFIAEKGFFHNFNHLAFLSSINSALGGLIVAAVLKYADSVLKGYSTAVSVLLTGIASHIIFGTELPILYWMGLINVSISIFLYNALGLDEPMF